MEARVAKRVGEICHSTFCSFFFFIVSYSYSYSYFWFWEFLGGRRERGFFIELNLNPFRVVDRRRRWCIFLLKFNYF